MEKKTVSQQEKNLEGNYQGAWTNPQQIIKYKEMYGKLGEMMIRGICNLVEYNPENIYFEDDIREKYNGENALWIKEHAGKDKDKILIYNPIYCLSDFDQWKPFFKVVDCSAELVNGVQLLIIPQRDIKFASAFQKDGINFNMGINYASATALVRQEEEFKKKQKPCENCLKVFASPLWRDKTTFENKFCFKCQNRWLQELGLEIRKNKQHE